MSKILSNIFGVLAIFCFAAPVFAQGQGTAAAGGCWWVAVAAGIGMAIASGMCGLAQGMATRGAAEGIARNPGATNAIQLVLILGLALIESLALYTLVVVFIKVR